jgi:glycerol kinase
VGDNAALADPEQSVYLVPAFVGLGAPHWNSEVRGAIFGLTRGTTERELCRAALEAVCYQTRDLLEAMKGDWSRGSDTTVLRVDGGMSASDWTLQFLADILDVSVDRPSNLEVTAIGAAYLAGLAAGLLPAPEAFGERWQRGRRFIPCMDQARRTQKYRFWKEAVRKAVA